MPFNGSGTFTRVMNWVSDAAGGIKIRADRHDTEDDNLASGLSQCITKNGETTITSNIPFNGKRITQLGAPVADTDACTKGFALSIKTFSTGVEITGANENGRLTFTSMTGANGLAWAGADLSWLARLATVAPDPVTPNRLALNDKADGSGADVFVISETGTVDAKGQIQTSAGRILSTQAGTSNAPSIGMHNTDRATCVGFWNGADNKLAFGSMDGAGNPITGWGTFSSAGDFVINTIHAAGAIVSGDRLVAYSDAAFGCYQVSGVRYHGFMNGYALLCNTATGDFTLQSAGGFRSLWRNSDGAFSIPTQGYKPGGGVWADSSDERIKNITGDYQAGLAEVLALQPVRFRYRGNDTMGPDGPSPHEAVLGRDYVGLIAQQAETVMPDLVSRAEGYIDGVAVDDLRMLDPSNLIYALVNAVKTLEARVRELEAK